MEPSTADCEIHFRLLWDYQLPKEEAQLYVERQFEDAFRTLLGGAAPIFLFERVRFSSFIVDFLACFSGVSLFQLVTKYGAFRAGIIKMASDVGALGKWIAPYLQDRTALQRSPDYQQRFGNLDIPPAPGEGTSDDDI